MGLLCREGLRRQDHEDRIGPQALGFRPKSFARDAARAHLWLAVLEEFDLHVVSTWLDQDDLHTWQGYGRRRPRAQIDHISVSMGITGKATVWNAARWLGRDHFR